MKGLTAGLVLAGTLSVWAAPLPLERIELIPADPAAFGSDRVFPSSAGETVEVELELGDTVEGQILRLHPAPGVQGEFIVEQSFQTSLTVMEEGPHLDLLDWKHYTAPWVPVRKLKATEFRTLVIPEADRTKFPAVTPKEIRAAVTRAGGPALGRLVAKVRGPNDAPCAVGVSRVSFRVLLRTEAGDKVLRVLHFLVPMGC